jgi:hypothetical protein
MHVRSAHQEGYGAHNKGNMPDARCVNLAGILGRDQASAQCAEQENLTKMQTRRRCALSVRREDGLPKEQTQLVFLALQESTQTSLVPNQSPRVKTARLEHTVLYLLSTLLQNAIVALRGLFRRLKVSTVTLAARHALLENGPMSSGPHRAQLASTVGLENGVVLPEQGRKTFVSAAPVADIRAQ